MSARALAALTLASFLHSALAQSFSVSISGDLGAQTTIIPNAFSTITVWDPQSLASPAPAGLADAYPFLTHVELFTATGGCYVGFAGCGGDRDLLNVPASGLAGGVNASRLFAPLRNILAAGLKPHVVTGNVPVALSGAAAHIGGFGFNSAPPANLSEYSDYIEQVAAQLAAEFGLAEVATWRWGVYTEYNNQDWLIGPAASYAALFDFTACGLERALGAANVDIGVHACEQCGAGAWDPVLFLQHVATGASACTGGPVHLNATGNSFYEHAAGEPGDLSWWAPQGRTILDSARALGLPTRRFGVDEGRLLWGPEGPSFGLTTRAVGDSYQGSFDAFFFKLLSATGVPDAYYARWGVNSGGGLFASGDGVVNNSASNVAQLAFRMNGSMLVPTTNTSAAPSLSIVDAVVGASAADGVLRALVFHHHPQLNVSGVPSAVASVALCGLSAAVPAGPVAGATATRVDDAHAQFWPAWRADAAAANISRAGGDYEDGWSEFSDNMPLASARAIALLAANTARYRLLAALAPEPLGAGGGANTGAVVGADRCVRFAIELPPHGVALVELPALAVRAPEAPASAPRAGDPSALPAGTPPPQLSWRPLGEPGCGGDITAVRVSPLNSSHIFIAGDMLGVGVSLDGGASFSAPAADAFLSYEHADFSFDATLGRVYAASASGPYYANASTPLVWASIREGFPAVNSDYGSYPAAVQVILVDPASSGARLLALGGSKRGWPRVKNGGVVWESTDAGRSWLNSTRVAPSGEQANVVWAQFSGSACVWAAVAGVGMVRSLDGGRTWATRWPASRSTALASGAAHPTDCDTAYAAMCDDGSVAKTTDGGATWVDASAGLPKGGCVEAFGSAGAADPLTLYAGNSNVAGSAFVSRDGAASWAPTGSPPSAQAYGLGMQSSFLSVHPADRDTVLYATWVTLWRSSDGGASWTDLTAQPAPGDATGTLWRGTGFGGLVTTNVAFNPYKSAAYPFERAFLQGMDAGKIWGAADAGAPPAFWKRQSGLNLFGGGNALAFAADGTTIYAGTGQFGWPSTYSTEGVVLSTDAGDSWAYACGAPAGLSGSTEATAVCVVPANASNVWAVFQDGRLYFSDSACRKWTRVEAVNDTVTGLVCPQAGSAAAASPDPADAELFAAGWRGVFALGPSWGSVGVNAWTLLPGGPTAWQYSTSDCRLAPLDAPEPRLVCANAWWDQWHSGLWTLNTTQARANVSDAAAAWSWPLKDDFAYRWAAAPGTGGRVQAYASNENPYPERCDAAGVFVSTDSGATWVREVEGLRMRRVSALDFSPDGTYLIAGLNGGGFYVADTSSLL
jgi:hypothetical protein